nr:hypothetical protein [Tanacetum cinerariifolium]
MQTQKSNTLHNAIMEAGSKDRPPMLAPGFPPSQGITFKLINNQSCLKSICTTHNIEDLLHVRDPILRINGSYRLLKGIRLLLVKASPRDTRNKDTQRRTVPVAFTSSSSSISSGYDNQVFNSHMFDYDELNSFESANSVPISPVNNRYKSGEGYHVVPPPYTGTFMPPKPDLVFHDAPAASETVPNVFNVKPSVTFLNF